MDDNEDTDLLLWLLQGFMNYENDLSKVRREVHSLLLDEAWRIAMRSRHYLTADCLDTPCDSAWMLLYLYGSDKNFLNVTSLTRAAFHQLLARFAGFYAIRPARSRGRPPKLRYLHQVLGLLLCFYTGSTKNGTLCMIFGAPPNTLSRTLRKAEEAIALALHGYAPARIAFPSPSAQRKLARLVEAREPLLQHTFGFIDGKNLRNTAQVMQPSSADLQNDMYNGWLHSVFVTGTICFAADGCIIWCNTTARGRGTTPTPPSGSE
uniref:DDE Tnp4 domain-containing protein n=1 Tax=Phytophthora ramorum TaxID=164328 RepID=H3H7Z6_PHYRM